MKTYRVYCKTCEKKYYDTLIPWTFVFWECVTCAGNVQLTIPRTTGHQLRLGLKSPGRWCRLGCCDLDDPQTGDCLI